MSKTFLGLSVLVVVLLAFLYFKGANKTVTESGPNVSTQTATTAPPVATPASPAATDASPSGLKMEETRVTISATGFEPKTLTVKAGAVVTWKNGSGEVASLNSAVHPTHLLYPPLNLGEVEDGASLSLVFDKVGSYKYHNHSKASQTGTVVVE